MFSHTIHTTIDIRAPPARVWQLLVADGMGAGSWNPFITRLEGELREGAVLSATAAVPGYPDYKFRPTITCLKPGEELRWRGVVLLPCLGQGEHYFRVEAAPSGESSGGGGTQAATRFVHGEQLSGLLLAFGGRRLAESEKAFVAMNEALKAVAEQGGGGGS